MAPSTNRVSVWAQSGDKQLSSADDSSAGHLAQSAISHASKRLLEGVQRVQRQQQSLRGPFGLDQKLNFLQNNSPWNTYTKVLSVDQAGPVIQACSKTRDSRVVAVKELRGYNMADFRNLIKPANEHVVRLHSAFFFDSSIYLVHENMEASLNEILVTPRGALPHEEVATICRSLLSGLSYMHNDMNAAHGDINGSTVLLSAKTGQVKIANVVERMLSWNVDTAARDRDAELLKKEDVHAVARLLVQMTELDTTLKDRTSRELQRPSECHETVVEMLNAMRTESCASLLKHDFIQQSRENFYLMPYILVAEKSSGRRIEFFLN